MLKLSATNLAKTYGSRKVVNGVNIEVQQGEIVGLLGPNGAGKTTSFYMAVGFIQPDEGKVFLDDRDITKLPMYQRAQLGISTSRGFNFQKDERRGQYQGSARNDETHERRTER